MAGEQTGGLPGDNADTATLPTAGSAGDAALNRAAAQLRQIDRRSTPRGTREQQREAKAEAGIDLRRYQLEPEDDGEPDNPEGGSGTEQTGELADSDTAKLPAELDPAEIVFYDKEGKPWTRAEAAEGVLRQADYSRKTAEVAQGRKHLSETQALVDQAANLAARAMQNIALALNGQLPQIPPEPDPSLEQTDPMAFFVQARRRDQIIAQHQQIAQQAAQIQQQQAAIRERQEAAEREEQGRVLLLKIPTWKDPAVKARDMSEIVQYCRDIGHTTVTEAEFAGVNHMLLIALRDAALGAKIRKNGGKKQTNQAPGLPSGRPVGTLTGQKAQATRGELAARISDKRLPVQDRINAAAAGLRAINQRNRR